VDFDVKCRDEHNDISDVPRRLRATCSASTECIFGGRVVGVDNGEATSQGAGPKLECDHDGVNLSCVDVCVLRAEKGIRLVFRDKDLLPVRVGWTPFIIEAAEVEVGGVCPQMVCVPSGLVNKTSPCCQRECGFPPFQVGDRVTR
jgi:hypothetical protein